MAEKPILATNIDGFLLNHDTFIEPHKLWFDRAISLTKDKSFEAWKGVKDYFKGVDLAMQKIMPEASEQERTYQARKWYQDDVLSYIKQHPESVNQSLASLLRKLKPKFTLALITTNTQDYIDKILLAAGLNGIYDIIFSSDLSEKPDSSDLFKKFVRQYGKPKFYIAGSGLDTFEEAKKLGIASIYLAPEKQGEEIASLAEHTIKSPLELEIILNQN